MSAPDQSTAPDFDAQFRAAIDAEIARGARLEDIRIRCGGLEWRWSRLMRRWDLWDPALVADMTKGTR